MGHALDDRAHRRGPMVTPFAYMFSTSFKAQAYVLTVPPQLIPRPATLDNYRRALTTQDFGR